MRECKEVW